MEDRRCDSGGVGQSYDLHRGYLHGVGDPIVAELPTVVLGSPAPNGSVGLQRAAAVVAEGDARDVGQSDDGDRNTLSLGNIDIILCGVSVAKLSIDVPAPADGCFVG
jgi:hypothetical protein